MPIARKIKVPMTMDERVFLVRLLDAHMLEYKGVLGRADINSPINAVDLENKLNLLTNLRRKIVKAPVI